MAHRLPPVVRFVAAAIAALIATLVIVGSAAADQRTIAANASADGLAPARPMDVVYSESLKLRYLRCEQAASQRVLDGPTIMSCSVVYEELKQRVFGGSFDALHAWWREARDRVVP